MRTVILFPNKDTYAFKYIESSKCEIFNVYKKPIPNIFVKLLRKFIYFLELGKCNVFYSDWTKLLKEDVQFIVFDSCKPYHRLQKKLKQAKIRPIIYFWNPIKSESDIRRLKKLKKYFKIYSYSIQDAQKYDLEYNPQFFVDIPITRSGLNEYDGIFIGKNKSRLKNLERIYSLFEKPFFYVVKDGEEISEILELQDKQMPYEEYLKFLDKSSSIAEILYTENADYSLRTTEALFYQKKLITNNKLIEQAPFYNAQNIYILNECTTKEDISEFLRIPFVPYSDEQIDYYKFDYWIERFKNESRNGE